MYQDSDMLCFGFPLLFNVDNSFPFWDQFHLFAIPNWIYTFSLITKPFTIY